MAPLPTTSFDIKMVFNCCGECRYSTLSLNLIFLAFFSVQLFCSAYTPRVVVVGGGVGGLATAARIAASNEKCDVVVLEKNTMLGGRCGSFDVQTKKGTFRHERGPSLLLLRHVYENVFQDCASSSPEAFGLTMRQCIPAYQVVFEDGDSIELGFPTTASDSSVSGGSVAEREEQSRTKMNSFEPNGALKWDNYMTATAAFLDCGLPNFIEEKLDLASFPAFLIESLRDVAKAWPLKPHSDVLDGFFDSCKMQALASFQDLYVGLEPYRNDKQLGGGVLRKTAPAVFGLLAAIELHPSNKKAGVFAPVGGFRAVEKALGSLAESKGVKIVCGMTVMRLCSDGVQICDSNDHKNSDFMQADLVIVNADLPYATKSLIDSSNPDPDELEMREPLNEVEPRFDWDDTFDFSSGVIAFHWSVDVELNDLNTHNVFLVAGSRENAERSWRAVRDPGQANKNVELEPFNFYVHRASLTDPTAAPEGCDALMILVPCRTLARKDDLADLPREEALNRYREQFDSSTISEARDAVLKRLAVINSLQDLENHIIDEVVDTPATYSDSYNVGAGTPFALSHGFGQLSVTRPAAETASMPNVLFVGASSRPGNGVPLVLIGSKLVASKAINRLSKLRSGS